MSYLELNLVLSARSPVHTTGNRITWQADKATALAANGTPIIPATTIKGLLRRSAIAWLATAGVRVCTGPEPGDMCSSLDDLCVTCRVFGNPRRISPLRFHDAVPAGDTALQVRSGVTISRQRRSALAGRVFFVETASATPAPWVATCTGYFTTAELGREAAALIALAARAIDAVGGGGSRGLGWIGSWRVSGTVDGDPLTNETLVSSWRSWLAGEGSWT
jgi:CRISPR/Cas system CSM-associated protein Csm3 (group 7 of RAMP superfamily)